MPTFMSAEMAASSMSPTQTVGSVPQPSMQDFPPACERSGSIALLSLMIELGDHKSIFRSFGTSPRAPTTRYGVILR